jgi:hypothetical protein
MVKEIEKRLIEVIAKYFSGVLSSRMEMDQEGDSAERRRRVTGTEDTQPATM